MKKKIINAIMRDIFNNRLKEGILMVYRIKYIFNGTRDKGVEISDYYGEFKTYELIQKDCVVEGVGGPLEDDRILPQIEYKSGFNPLNRHMRKKFRDDAGEYNQPIIESEKFEPEKFGIIGGEWVTKNWDDGSDDENHSREARLSEYMVGTELANFLNFDLDVFMNGTYELVWKYEKYKDVDDEGDEDKKNDEDEVKGREVIIGWKPHGGYDLKELNVRQTVSSAIVNGVIYEGKETENIPFFIRMFGCKFINTDTWEYDIQEVEKIKHLQQRIRDFCEKVFFPADENDKRTNFERFCENIDSIEKKELRKRVPNDWITPSSLEQALSYECYAMIKGNVNFFKCKNCGLYTVAKDNRSRSCGRLIDDGRIDKNMIKEDYYYVCKEESHIRSVKEKVTARLITTITGYEEKRLYNHISKFPEMQEEKIKNKMVMAFADVIYENEEKFLLREELAKSEGEILDLGNEYLMLIAEEMNKHIKSILGKDMRKCHLFDRRKNAVVKSTTGNIFK